MNLTSQQLKELIANHEVKWNLTVLNKKAQELVDLTAKLLKVLEVVESGAEINQTQLLKDLEQLRITKHHFRGIRFIYFYQALKGEKPKYDTTFKFEAKEWEEKRELWEEKRKERREKEQNK